MCLSLHIACKSLFLFFFFFNDTATTEIYTLSLHDALPILTEAMTTNNVGFVSARDNFVIDFEEQKLRHRIQELRAKETDVPSSEIEQKYDLKNTSSWNLVAARARLRVNQQWERDFVECLYRPFDVRHVYYSLDILERPVHQIQRHMLFGKNLGLCTTRSIEIGRGWEHIFCTTHIVQHHTVSIKEVNYLFPLYLYPDHTKAHLFDAKELTNAPGGRLPNLSTNFVEEFAERLMINFVPDGNGDLKKTFGPKDVFDYL